MPSGNGVAAFALQRLGHLFGEARYLEAAERTLKLCYPALAQQPSGSPSMLMALQEYLAPPQIVILRGAPGASAAWRRQLMQHYWTGALILILEGEFANLPETLAKPLSQGVSAWVCQGVRCLPVIEDCTELIAVCKSGETG
jgi:uncharacterized protein YyaL (SSP411 family)